jgi:hypothetical protein
LRRYGNGETDKIKAETQLTNATACKQLFEYDPQSVIPDMIIEAALRVNETTVNDCLD